MATEYTEIDPIVGVLPKQIPGQFTFGGFPTVSISQVITLNILPT